MGLGGVLFAGAGIIVTVLVANGRWPSVWASMLGQNAPAAIAAGATSNTGSASTTTVNTSNGPVYQTPYGDYTLQS